MKIEQANYIRTVLNRLERLTEIKNRLEIMRDKSQNLEVTFKMEDLFNKLDEITINKKRLPEEQDLNNLLINSAITELSKNIIDLEKILEEK